jgi:hypothetical protein
MGKSAQRARARERRFSDIKGRPQAVSAWSGKRVSFAAAPGVASDFPASHR